MRYPRSPGMSRWSLAGAAVLSSALLGLVLAAGGCTSDDANTVGAPLVEATYDTVLAPLQIDQIDHYSAFMVENTAMAVHQQEILYVGEQQGTRSRLMANFDFAFEDSVTGTYRDTVAYPDSLFTENNIKNVFFSLVKPEYYQAYEIENDERGDETGQPIDLFYVVQQIEAPFDSTVYVGYPNEVPAVLPGILNSDFNTPNDFDEPFLRLDVRDFVEWFQARERIGIIVEFDEQSDEGLVGFGSRDMVRFSELSDQFEGTVVAPNFVVEFDSTYVGTNERYLMAPYADTSTFEAVPEAPTDPNDGILLRTGLRSYPAMFFDYSGLPENARINRAVIHLVNETATTYGRYQAVVVSEIDSTEVNAPLREITLDELDDPDYLYQLSGDYFDPALSDTSFTVVELEVTTAVQRYVNRVTEGTKALIVTAGEYIPAITFRAGVPVDMYYSQFNFYGLSGPEEWRPQLRITYSLIDELSEGGE